MQTNDQTVLSEKEVFHVVFQDLGTHDFEILDSKLKPIGETATGFLGEHKRLEVTVDLNGPKKSKKKLTYFVKKTSNEAPTQKEFLEKTGCFLKEIGIYKTIFKEFDKVLTENVIKWRPKYFHSKGLDLFVIEDLSASEYYLFPERTLLDKEHVLVALRSLAAMHASSVLLEEKLRQGKLKLDSSTSISVNSNTTVWDLYQDLLFEGDFPAGLEEFSHIHHETAIKAEKEIIDHLPNFTEREKVMIKKKLPDAMRRVFELVKPSNK